MSNSSVASQTLLPVSDNEALGLYARKDPRELYRRAEQQCLEVFGPGVYLRGLIEYTNYCTQGCLYCGIARDLPNPAGPEPGAGARDTGRQPKTVSRGESTDHRDSADHPTPREFPNLSTHGASLDRSSRGVGEHRKKTRISRYRLDEQRIMEVIRRGMDAGLRSFVLQGGEDPSWQPHRLCRLVETIKTAIARSSAPDTALTLSAGCLAIPVYRRLADSGLDRYLLRFETSDPVLFSNLRPGTSLTRRIDTLRAIRDAGLEVGSGYMTGLPGETEETRINNALVCRDLGVDMVGVGPFIPHPATPLGTAPQQPLELALKATALLRLLLPQANIPATTAAGTLHPRGREAMLCAGANVLMPNITPVDKKPMYQLYPGKICITESGFECLSCLSIKTRTIRRTLDYSRGTSPGFTPPNQGGQPCLSL
ncbi:radical SAM protein [Spirochaeta lutea]|uniref:radical SAM protein n=1 Tax=Spirochaeta lutea TaxID=1480694 RepID=UPI00069039EE|nr:radical SAM protein [Spirochaeta lutea]